MSDTVSSGSNISGIYDTLFDSDVLHINKFDTSLGTLNSVSYSFSGAYIHSAANATFTNDSWGFSSVGGDQSLSDMHANVFLPGYAYNNFAGLRVNACSGTGGLFSGAQCQTNIPGLTAYLPAAGSFSSASILSLYSGTGALAINTYVSGLMHTYERTGNGYVDYRYGNLSSGGKLTITYDYTAPPPPVAAVPEPPTLFLLGAGLLGFGLFRRRRRTV